ncbi:hypothetical protein Q31b_30790 [Novipirellula aureliae]|uniref:Chromo domain-containing protein n=1 Tax=Novipirellula aureliae TaxID=2527966 RepID=A0A5C6DYV9_9BACT|nr:DUF481 domain-containing protein [Novipirellula aureliae]TWU41625.1 hypothetical protein Q31b_30790 [Novipirellula aureliae]
MTNARQENRAIGIACLVWTVFLAVSSLSTSVSVAAQPPSEVDGNSIAEIPLWQQGVSTWNGSRYAEPTPIADSPIAQVSVEAPTSTAPYTVPFDPSMQAIGIGATNDSTRIARTGMPPELVGPSVNDFEMLGEPKAIYWDDSAPIGQGLAPPVVSNGASNGVPDLNMEDNESTFTPPRETDFESEPIVIETPPLQEEVLRWYQYPIRWMKGWDSNAEFGLDGSSGNAETLALQTGLELKRKTDLYTFSIDTDYRIATSRRVTTEDNGRFNIDYDRMFSESAWSLFGKYGMEWDAFKAFDLRLNLNGGIGYHWFRTDDTTLVTRFGAGASREIGAPIDEWTPEGVFGIEGERQITSRQKVKAKIDYFPSWEDFTDYRLVSDVSWEILLDGSDNLSLKLAATDRYDSTPQGAKRNDVYYSLLLLYKF